MLFYLVIGIFLVALYVAFETAAIAKHQAAMAEYLRVALEEIKTAQTLPPTKQFAYGWYDGGWPFLPSNEEERAPLENPAPHRGADDYLTAMYLAEYNALAAPNERREFLRHLNRNGVWMREPLLDAVFADPSPFVRAWAAAHLDIDRKDYSDWKNPVGIRDYEPALLADEDPLVRASLWSNPKCSRLPWGMIRVAEDWKEHFKGLAQLERLAMMRNPKLSMHYVVALLETSTDELGLSRTEHAAVLSAAASNPDIVWSSRAHGRDFWLAQGDANSPFEEYGRMWKLSIDKWRDVPRVVHAFLKYVQTTPEVKIETYSDLRSDKPEETKWLRQEIISSCDPMQDRKVLKLAWDDPDEECRKIAAERVGRFSKFVGVSERKAGSPQQKRSL
ncbi:MAG TPA: hypothetical protein VJN96_04185 [Vicinamibacterales bacterium]|nr:hypothetical protein [Vicinamibacterales bacterium]